MASITRRGTGWFVQIRRKGFRPRFKTFADHASARKWARDEEAAMDNGYGRSGPIVGAEPSVGEVLARYRLESSPKKKGAEIERLRLLKMQSAPFAQVLISKLTSSVMADYRDQRLSHVQPTTVRRELGLIRSVLETARNEWGLPLRGNPVSQISIPSPRDARERRLEDGELEKLLGAIERGRNIYLQPLVLLALETGLRRGELLRLTWADVRLECRTALIRDTKNGSDRTIPLTRTAVQILTELPQAEGAIFPISPNALRKCWKRACRLAEIDDLRFHDLRHEAISRLFELGLSVPEVALISGHRDVRMLFRYTHLTAEKVRDRLDYLRLF